MGRLKTETNEVSDEMAELLSKFKENTVKIDNGQHEEEQQESKERKHFDIINKIQKINNDFNEIDEYFENLSSYQSQIDEYISDFRRVDIHCSRLWLGRPNIRSTDTLSKPALLA